MSKKTDTITPADLTDEELARETIADQRIINLGGRAREHFNRPTREEGLRRLHKVGHALTGQVEELAREVARQLAKGEGDVSTDTLTRYAALFALAAGDHPALDHVATVIDAPVPPSESDPWGYRSDAEANAAKSERASTLAAARVQMIVLTAEAKRRRIAAEDAIEVERLERHRASRGVS